MRGPSDDFTGGLGIGGGLAGSGDDQSRLVSAAGASSLAAPAACTPCPDILPRHPSHRRRRPVLLAGAAMLYTAALLFALVASSGVPGRLAVISRNFLLWLHLDNLGRIRSCGALQVDNIPPQLACRQRAAAAVPDGHFPHVAAPGRGATGPWRRLRPPTSKLGRPRRC